MMKVLLDRMGKGVDQPYIAAATFAAGAGKKKDRVYVGDNDFNADGGRTATIDQTLNGADTKPGFTTTRIESRRRPARTARPSGPRFMQTAPCTASFTPGVLSTTAAEKELPMWSWFATIKEAQVPIRSPIWSIPAITNQESGSSAVRNSTSTACWDCNARAATSGSLSTKQSDIVYVAYNDDQPDGAYALHILRSTDRGQTWSPELKRVNNALNPAMATNTDGKLGLLYQQLAGAGANQQWVTKFETTTNGTSWSALTLAQVPANRPPKQFDPYLGDYEHLMAVGKDFYGIFSANNTPKKTNFPNDVVYQRNVNWKRTRFWTSTTSRRWASR